MKPFVVVSFIRNNEKVAVELCSLAYALEYVQNVVVKNGWKFVSMRNYE